MSSPVIASGAAPIVIVLTANISISLGCLIIEKALPDAAVKVIEKLNLLLASDVDVVITCDPVVVPYLGVMLSNGLVKVKVAPSETDPLTAVDNV